MRTVEIVQAIIADALDERRRTVDQLALEMANLLSPLPVGTRLTLSKHVIDIKTCTVVVHSGQTGDGT